MRRAKHLVHESRRGSTLILSLIFITMFAALATAMASLSGTNVQVAENQRRLDNVRACAESGVEVVRYWISQVAISGLTDPEDRFSTLASMLQTKLNDAVITNIQPVCTATTVTISNVPLNSSSGQSFSAVLTKIDDNIVQLDVTGHYGSLSRTIRSNYFFDTRAHTVFDFGVASKGPLTLSGNIDMEGANIDIESNAYIESWNSWTALDIIGNSHIGGTVKIANPSASVNIQGGQAGIGGVTGEEAAQPPYTQYGAPPTEFPEMNPAPFIDFINSTDAMTHVLDANDDTSADATYSNLMIPAGMNPTFSGQSTLNGVIYIETPNVVTFSGGTTITGVIVTDGSATDDSGTNQIDFQGNVTSYPVSSLPAGGQFDFVRDQTGTFMMTPGFHASFGGNFVTPLCGAIAANGVEFYGNAGGTIYGSIINYSDTDMILSGNNDLFFNRSGLTEVPAGFVPQLILHYNPSTYAEVL
jgi:Tfp pilus assembly protein PilX